MVGGVPSMVWGAPSMMEAVRSMVEAVPSKARAAPRKAGAVPSKAGAAFCCSALSTDTDRVDEACPTEVFQASALWESGHACSFKVYFTQPPTSLQVPSGSHNGPKTVLGGYHNNWPLAAAGGNIVGNRRGFVLH